MAVRPTAPAEDVHPLHPVSGGWHVSHLYYSFDRKALAGLSKDQLTSACGAMMRVLDPAGPDAPTRLQTTITSGHKADFGVMAMDPDPLVVESVNQRLMASAIGTCLVPGYSFVSVTEISEYVFTVEQYGERLVAEGEAKDSESWNIKVKAYEARLEAMNRQRLTPDFPPYRATCFYPMNKKRKVGENWFLLSKEDRNRLMAEHARSGIAFAGKVSQLISVGLGFEDWEWGVTLWGANPDYLKQIVYQMRFDEASARYAEFGPFLIGYVSTPEEILQHCRIG
jgi:hydrogen peroxide-dependent heme synthase